MRKELLKGLTEEQIKKVEACKSPEEILELAKSEGVSLNDEQLDTVAGGCRMERLELENVMNYDPDFKNYLKRYGSNGDSAAQNYLADKLGIHSRLNGEITTVKGFLDRKAEYWDDKGRKYTHKEVKALLRIKVGLDV